MTGGILVTYRNGFIKMWSSFGVNISVHVNAVDDVLKGSHYQSKTIITTLEYLQN